MVRKMYWSNEEKEFLSFVKKSIEIFNSKLKASNCSCKLLKRGRCLHGLFSTNVVCKLIYSGKEYRIRIGISFPRNTFVIQLMDKVDLTQDMMGMLYTNFGYLGWYFQKGRVIFYSNEFPVSTDYNYLVNILLSSLKSIPIHESNINVVRQSCK